MTHYFPMVALAVVLVPVPAVAQLRTYYHAGVWDAVSGRNDREGAVCGFGTTMPQDNRRLSVNFAIGGSDTVFSASKPDWSIPDNTRVTVVMQIGLNTPWSARGTGHEHAIDWTLPPAAMAAFDKQFRGSSSMTLTFPDGSEPPWTVSLAGSTVIGETFKRCVSDLTRQMHAAQPPPDAATAPGATQPFAAPAPPVH